MEAWSSRLWPLAGRGLYTRRWAHDSPARYFRQRRRFGVAPRAHAAAAPVRQPQDNTLIILLFPRRLAPPPGRRHKNRPAPAQVAMAAGRLGLERLELVDHGLDHRQAAVPEGAPRGVEAEARDQFGIVLRSACLQHRQILVGKIRVALPIERVERVHQTIAEGVGVDVKRRVHKMRNVGPVVLVARAELDRRPEALGLHLKPELAQAFGGELALAPFLVHLALEAIEGDLAHDGI